MKLSRFIDKILPRRLEKRKAERDKRKLRFQLPKTEDTALKVSVLEYGIRKLGTKVFIETGTYHGGTTCMAATLFEEVHTIELDEQLHAAAREKFHSQKHVSCHHGDSAVVLPWVLEGIGDRAVFFWLDGHYSDRGTARGQKNTPIIEEIEAVKRAGLSRWIILIDDLRIFGARPAQEECDQTLVGYPTVKEVLAALRRVDAKVALGVWGDVLVAVASAFDRPLDDLSRALLTSRAYDGAGKDDDASLRAALKAEKKLTKCAPDKIKNLETLAHGFRRSEKRGLAGHYHLWAGLALLGAQRHEDAAAHLASALKLDVRHWRVSCYLSQALLGAGRRLEAWSIITPLQWREPIHSLVDATLKNVLNKRADSAPAAQSWRQTLELVRRLLPKSPVVFELGAQAGEWTVEALSILHPRVLHVFDTDPLSHQFLPRRLAADIGAGRIVFNNAAAPLDDYCPATGIRRIHLLRLSGAGLDALHGAERMSARQNIDVILFEDVRSNAADIIAVLQGHGMSVFWMAPEGPQPLEADETCTDGNRTAFVAVHPRLQDHVTGRTSRRDWRRQFELFGRKREVVVHVGAHEGREQPVYEQLGFRKMIYVEANPEVFEKLKQNVASRPGVKLFCGAASDCAGETELRITSMDQSSSLLPLKKHLEIYPDIKEVGRIPVRTSRLDDIVAGAGESPEACSFLNIDVQGAELQVLRGAPKLLRHVEAVNVEVNFEELYEGAPSLDEVDAELESHGFDRVAIDTPFHPLWGDAFYVRRGVVSMSSLGTNGRFGNQIFQYMFLRLYGRNHGVNVQTPAWIGRVIFHADDAWCAAVPLPEIRDLARNAKDSVLLNATTIPRDVDLWGYFQFHTSYYRPHRDFIRSLFRPADHIASQVEEKLAILRSRAATLVVIHLRRGDYGAGAYFRAPTSWYHEWLKSFWQTLDRPVLYVASDEAASVKMELAEFNPIMADDLGGIHFPENTDYLLDFLVMTHADVLAISNSSFSFAAAMLNQRSSVFARPRLPSRRLIPFDPWNSDVLLRDMAEDYPDGWLAEARQPMEG